MEISEYGKNKLIEILNNGKKNYENKEEKLFVFLPKAIITSGKKYIAFPFFIKEKNKYRLVFWRALNITNLKYKIFNPSEEKYIDEKNIDINLLEDDTKKLIKEFGELYQKYEKNIKENIENDVKDLEDFQDKLKKSFNDELYYIYFDEKREAKNDNKTEEDANDLEETNNSCKYNLQEPGEDKYTVEELLEKFNKIKIKENQKYIPELENGVGLKYVSDEMLDIAYEFLSVGDIRIDYDDSQKKEKVRVYHHFDSICTSESDSEYLKYLKDGNNTIKEETYHWFRVNEKGIVNFRNCCRCKYSKCPSLLSGMILNYMLNNELERKLREREEFRKNAFRSNYFEFEWKTENGLKDIPDDTFNLCEKLVDNGFVKVDPILFDTNSVRIWYIPVSCYEFELLKGDFSKLEIKDKFYDYDSWKCIKRSSEQLLKYCTDYNCNYSACIYSVAGYIYYLKRMGLDSKIKEDRKYYKEHEKEIIEEVDKLKQEAIKNQKQKKEEKLKELSQYSNRISNINDLTNNIISINQHQFHMTLEGNDIKTIEECANSIKDVFNNLGYTNGFSRISLQNLASDNVTENYSYNNMYLYKWIYNELDNDKLYIINGIREFVDDYKLYQQYGSSSYKELRTKQFNHILKLLTNVSARNFIILEGTQEEINDLFELNSGLKFVFQQNRYIVSETSIDEMYKLFYKGLNSNIRNTYANDNTVKEKFIDFIALNKEYMPFTNTEISNYLSNYCNMNNKIKFPENVYKKETVDESLAAIIGMDTIKAKVKEFEKYVMFNIKAKTLGLELANSNLHMVFTGNPGTGKTTIARIMAKMLFDLGLIKENKLVEVERKDLVAGYIGQTAIKTAEIIEKAKGGVLFVDEAYSLAQKNVDKDFGKEAIATLIKAMEDQKDELVCIFAGYKDEMNEFLNINPGITSRIGYTFDFPDYNTDELIQIFEVKMKKMGFTLNKKVPEKLRVVFDYFVKRKSFGNGRFVDKIIQAILLKHSNNDDENIKEITINDIPTIEEMMTAKKEDDCTASEMVENLVGMEKIKAKLKDFNAYNQFVKEAKEKGLNMPDQNMHMIFTGNPGTGKTTIARIIAKMLYEMEIIHENKLVEVERKDLVAGYIGQTAMKTSEVIEKAMGGVLFIDEAYSLTPKAGSSDSFGEEAIATLIKAMEDHKGEFIVIFAGYSDEMNEFVKINPGIASRIGYVFEFEDYTREELCEIYYRNLDKIGFILKEDAKTAVFELMNYFHSVDNIGNGRFVDRVVQETIIKHSKNKKRVYNEIVKEDIPTIKEITELLINGKNMIDVEKLSDESIYRTAVHEIGHAALRYIKTKKPGIKIITINAEGRGTLGYVSYKNDYRDNLSKQELMDRITVLLGGMASEQVILGNYQTGATSDLEKATNIARNMITRYGMGNHGLASMGQVQGEMEVVIYNQINEILDECFNEAVKMVEKNKDKMKNAIDYLYKNKEITEENFIKEFKKK